MPEPGRDSFAVRELWYELPAALIAQQPAEPRDASRLMVVERAPCENRSRTGQITHAVFSQLGAWLRPGDCLVLNNTQVLPARFFCRRETGGRVEGLFLHQEREGESGSASPGWRVLLKPAARLRVGERLSCEAAESHRIIIVARHERGEWTVRPEPEIAAEALLHQIGETPLPPYIQRDDKPTSRDGERYQTVYARRAGAVAAPTAGLHFTPQLLSALRAKGVRTAEVTLHVGLGTFAPIEVDDLRDHRMHAEWFECPAETRHELAQTRATGGRVIAVGTTSARVLESLDALGSAPPRQGNSLAAARQGAGGGEAVTGWTDIFIYPPYSFRNVDGLITNFHLPGSTLLALAMAFAGVEAVRAAYHAAIEHRYRFYSYGDAMLLI